MIYRNIDISLHESTGPVAKSQFNVRSDGAFYWTESKFGTVFGVNTERVLSDSKLLIDKILDTQT